MSAFLTKCRTIYGVYWLIKALAILDGLTERTRRGMNAAA
ncbi:hypothetical protein ECW_m0973 [Escherichia coli W]|jgi:hypothetical protein|uniref:Uncharacterized protein n=1 Tax=Escherichia coli (strain ATCC 9637 / CCM 2024 / DSM 1116 / LMG 11080 / NBRC 13500 / NCIMB 8666 / NRRL B-766 / W) TaxID=566546 RepID=A0A0H3ESJ7_ECOLW|nr:hypothetical protein ECW_m0973 [Escherichia coli W]